MNIQNSPFGASIASQLPIPADFCDPPCLGVQTVGELLDLVALEHPTQPISMLRTAASWFARYARASIGDLKIDLLEDALPGFKPYLREQKQLAPKSAKSYRDFVVRLLRLARELGWVRTPSRARTEWENLRAGFRLPTGFSSLVSYAIAKGKTPAQLTDKDLAGWAESAVLRGTSHMYARNQIRKLLLAILRANAQDKFPLVSTENLRPKLAVPIDEMPEPLQGEIRALMHWKQDLFVPGRPAKQKHGPATAKMLTDCISRLYGYAINTLKRTDTVHFADLVKEEIVTAYITWAVNEKHLKDHSFKCFILLNAAVRQYPHFKGQNLDWFSALLAAIPVEPESDKKARKALKYLPYDELSAIPAKMVQARQRLQQGTREYAEMFHDELMLRWLLVLPWRQRNIREARLATSERPNIFKEGFTPLVNMAKPPWVEEELKRNPRAEFWQVFFRVSETKMRHEVRAVLPQQLVPMFEEYLLHCRPLLVGDSDPHTVFLQRCGRPLKQCSVTQIISKLTAKYAGRRVTPHIFRDSFAHQWLIENPRDYLTLSKILWHKSIQTTIRIYGSNYDESHGVCNTDAWLERRKP
jgi:integrase